MTFVPNIKPADLPIPKALRKRKPTMKLYNIPVKLPVIGQVVFVSMEGYVTRERVTAIEMTIDATSPPMEPEVWIAMENHVGAQGHVPLREVHATHAEACARAFEREFAVTPINDAAPGGTTGPSDDLLAGLEA